MFTAGFTGLQVLQCRFTLQGLLNPFIILIFLQDILFIKENTRALYVCGSLESLAIRFTCTVYKKYIFFFIGQF